MNTFRKMATLKASLLADSTSIRVELEITSDRLEVIVLAAAGIVTVLYIFREPIRNAFRNPNIPHEEPVIEDIQNGSLIVKLRFLTPSSFLRFYDDYKSGKLKKSLADEILKLTTKPTTETATTMTVFDESLPVKFKESLEEKFKNLRFDDKLTVKIRDEEKVKNHAEKLRENSVESVERVKMNPSKSDHNNWITVGALINLIRKPIAIYADHIVKNWHKKLCHDCSAFGTCTNPASCLTEKKSHNLCSSCKGWYNKLESLHRSVNKSQIKWRQNCDTSKWPVDAWEVAKFFMSILGDNKKAVKDAESTDLSSLLNVLEWMEDVAFGGDRRVDLDLVRKLRSEVRNTWAHASNQEMTDVELNNGFVIAIEFLADLDTVISRKEVKECDEEIQFLQANGLTNVVEAELNSLLLLRKELCVDVNQMKEEIKNLEQTQTSDRQVIEVNGRKLKDLEEFTKQCCIRMDDFQKWKENLDNLFNNFRPQMESFRQETERNFTEIRVAIKEIQDTMSVQENEQSKLNCCLPEKLSTFVSRNTEIDSVRNFLKQESCGIVSIVGSPGFGKSTIAVQVSHQLKEENIPVIFSYLSNTSTVPEVIQRLCHDIGVYPGEDPKSSLICWCGNIKEKVVLVMDNIEQLLECNTRSEFTDLVLTLRKNSNQQIQILTTSRTVFLIPNLNEVEKVPVGEMDKESSVQLLKKCCRNEEIEDEYLRKLANLCGHVPLALCIAASRIREFEDHAELIRWLEKRPMEALKCSERNQHVQNAIQMSFERLKDKDKKAFVRLAMFDGDFNRDAAQEIIERNPYQTQDFLKNLVDRSLIQRTAAGRFLIHSLVRRFLTDYGQLQDERPAAQELMVKHFLKLCQSWTEKYYSKDGSSDARELLKKDAHNVEKMLKVYQGANLEQSIVESLLCSGIYQSSSRFFYNFIRCIFPQTVVKNFLEFCVELAEKENQLAIQISFQCLLVDQEGRKSVWKSSEYIERVKEVKKAFERNEENLKKDSALCSHFYYIYGRWLSRIDPTSSCPDPLKEANDYLEESLRLRESREGSPVERADEAITLCQLGLISKRRAKSDKETHENLMTCAKNHYEQALESAKELLGDHEVTSTCYKVLGDLYLVWRMPEEALPYYKDAKDMYKKLGGDFSESMVNLLKNYGLCFSYIHCFEEAKEQFNEAREIADKLGDGRTPCRAQLYYSLAQCFRRGGNFQEAADYAGVAIKLKEFLSKEQLKKMEKLIEPEENTWR